MQHKSNWRQWSLIGCLLCAGLLCGLVGLAYRSRVMQPAAIGTPAAITAVAPDGRVSTTVSEELAAERGVDAGSEIEGSEIEEGSEPTVVSTQQRLVTHVKVLSESIGERNLRRYKNLNAAADYVKRQFADMGYSVETQAFDVQGRECRNLIVEIPGAALATEIIVVGAHYDSAPGTPGANDNASGVAALLVIAEQLRGLTPARTLRFVAFTNEEPPYFQREEQMGSWVYARACRARGDDIVGAISLETIGYFSDEVGSQQYPPLLASSYPNTGNFIGFVANLKSRGFLNQVLKEFQQHSQVASESASLPEVIEGVGWSDHWSFWQEDYVGLMITDTAPFRYPHYHLETDTPDKLDWDRYTLVVEALVPTIEQLVK